VSALGGFRPLGQIREGDAVHRAVVKRPITQKVTKGPRSSPRPPPAQSSGARSQGWTGYTDASKSRDQIITEDSISITQSLFGLLELPCTNGHRRSTKFQWPLLATGLVMKRRQKSWRISSISCQEKSLVLLSTEKSPQKIPTYLGIDSYSHEEYKTPYLAVFRHEKTACRFLIRF
jgi:hypothetical protein